ncbi:DNA primase family protein [Streptomyces sp. 1222.5]|uniref:DNA primase family protein n=1 Tax=Streptomyces sp. 1222.5 TaxID=1881026 RepID=UPI003D74C258
MAELGITSLYDLDDLPPDVPRALVQSRGMVFTARDLHGRVSHVVRPDEPAVNKDGDTVKYVNQSGAEPVLWHFRSAQPGHPTLVVEGCLQSRQAVLSAPAEWGVIGLNGCWGWVGTDLLWAEGQDVVLLFDKDVTTNHHVWDAADGLREALAAEGAGSVRLAKLAGARGTDGLDDVMARRPEDKRTPYLQRIVEAATKRLPKRPPQRKSRYFDASGALLADTLAKAVTDDYPAALTAEGKVALYQDGVYRLNGLGFAAAVSERLGEQYRPGHLLTAEQKVQARLYTQGLQLPERQAEPVVNLANGMLDLRTGELADWGPEYLSTAQLPVAWDPEALCPTYEAWLAEVCPDQIDDLEEVASTMLDPSRTPPKALFLYGPSRSGKSTFLRLMEAVAGRENISAVTLHQLSDNRFVAASIYGKILNAAADLSGRDVSDTSLFKMLTGEDVIDAERKYGGRFQFTNRALFAFSANELPQVSEASRAYTERVKPFRFGSSFAGREDPEIERKMHDELPGIVARWVRAWQRMSLRGGRYAATQAEVQAEFEMRSDRVRQWFDEELDVASKTGAGMTAAEIHRLFKKWAEDNGGHPMGRNQLMARLRNCPGVAEARVGASRTRGLNVIRKPGCDPFE